MRLALVAALALALVPAARGATTTTNPLAPPSPVPTSSQPRLTTAQATRIFLRDPKVVAWLKRYPKSPITQATFAKGDWTVNVFSGKAGEIAIGQAAPFEEITVWNNAA